MIQAIRTRVLSGKAPITGKSRVIRNDSIRKSPIEISTMMMTTMAPMRAYSKNSFHSYWFCFYLCDGGGTRRQVFLLQLFKASDPVKVKTLP